MIGRAGTRRATVLNPNFAKVDAIPVPEALGDTDLSIGYASRAGAPARLAAAMAAAINALVTPRRRYPIRT